MKGVWKCAKKGDTKEFTRLLSKGESIQETDNVNRTCLHYSSEANSVDIVKLILNNGGGSIIDQRDQKGETALELAIQNGHEELAVLLVAHGANLDTLNKRIVVPKRLELKLKDASQTRFGAGGRGTGSSSPSVFVDKSLPMFEEPTFTSPDTTSPAVDESFVMSVQATVVPIPRATPAPPTFANRTQSQSLIGTEVPRNHPQPQQARMVSTTPTNVSVPVQTNLGGIVVDVATVIELMSHVVLAGLYEEFNPNQLKELNNAIGKLTNYLPTPKDGLRVVSQNLREVGQFPVLGPMSASRTKRVKEDYVALYERIRPLQDATRIVELDRRAHAPALVHPPLLYLIGGTFSMFISIEQPYPSNLDQVVAGISRAIRELPPSPVRNQFGSLVSAFVQFLRCASVRVLEIRDPAANYDIVQIILAMSKATRCLLLDSTSAVAQLKVLVENLKNVMVTIKSTMPSLVGKELVPSEESTLYKDANDQFAQTTEAMARKAKEIPPQELELAKRIANQISKLQSGFKEIHSMSNPKEKMKGGLGALGRGVLRDAQQVAIAAAELAQLAAARLAQTEEQDEWKEAKLSSLEVFVLSAKMIDLVVACIGVRNRLPNHSHVPILLVLLSIASQFALHPYM